VLRVEGWGLEGHPQTNSMRRIVKITDHTLHPTLYTLRPTPFTLHHTPHTPHPTPYELRVEG
jgi:hypothetical protein